MVLILLASRMIKNRNMPCVAFWELFRGAWVDGGGLVPYDCGTGQSQAHVMSSGEEKLSLGFSVMGKIISRRFQGPVSREFCGNEKGC